MTGRADVERVVDELYDAYNRRDAAAAAALYAADGAHCEIAQGAVRQGPDAVRQGLEHFFEAFPDAEWQSVRRVVGDSEAAVTYRLTGTLRSRLGPFAPDGQRLDLQGVHVVEVADGRIAVCEDYWDASTFGRQMQRG